VQAIVCQGHAFPEDFFAPEEGLIWSDRRWEQRLDKGTAQRRFRDARFVIGYTLKNLAERQQARKHGRPSVTCFNPSLDF